MNSSIISESLNKRDFWQIEIPVQYARAFGVVSFILLICLGAHLKLFMPGNPVPITLQTFFVLMAGAMLGPRYGTLAVISYIFLGAMGMPMFAPGGAIGFLCLIGPTGGYLLGFILAAWIVGCITQKSKNSASLAMALIIGEIAILTLGCIHLGFITGMGLKAAFAIGVLPFIAGDIVKVAAVWVSVSMAGKARTRLLN
jgi:biotin transport system substrate-specific component